MADQNTQQQQQQQRAPSRSVWDERVVACVMRIWKAEHDSAERILSSLNTIIEAAQKEQDPGKRETMIVSHLYITGMSLGILSLKLWQKNTTLVNHINMLFLHVTRAGGNFLPDVAVDAAIAALQRNVNPLQMYPVVLERHQQQLQQARAEWPDKITDPEGITTVVSKDPTAHIDPGSVAFPALRPTLSGGVPLGIQNGMWHLGLLFVFTNFL
jgi:hypothetical protein